MSVDLTVSENTPVDQAHDSLMSSLTPLFYNQEAKPGEPIAAHHVNRLRKLFEIFERHEHKMVVSGTIAQQSEITSAPLSVTDKILYINNATPPTGEGPPSSTWTGKHFLYYDTILGEWCAPNLVADGTDAETYSIAGRTPTIVSRRYVHPVHRVVPNLYLPGPSTSDFYFIPTTGASPVLVTTDDASGTLLYGGDSIDAEHINQLRKAVEWGETHIHAFEFEDASINSTAKTKLVWFGKSIEQKNHRLGDNQEVVEDPSLPSTILANFYNSEDGSWHPAPGNVGVWRDDKTPSPNVYKAACYTNIFGPGEEDGNMIEFTAAGMLETARVSWEGYSYLTMLISTDYARTPVINASIQIYEGTNEELGAGNIFEEATFAPVSPNESITDWEGRFKVIWWALTPRCVAAGARIRNIRLVSRDPEANDPEYQGGYKLYFSTIGVTQDLRVPYGLYDGKAKDGTWSLIGNAYIKGTTDAASFVSSSGPRSAKWTEDGVGVHIRLKNNTNTPRSAHINEIGDASRILEQHTHNITDIYVAEDVVISKISGDI